jgi:hypothetical protein
MSCELGVTLFSQFIGHSLNCAKRGYCNLHRISGLVTDKFYKSCLMDLSYIVVGLSSSRVMVTSILWWSISTSRIS